MRNGANLGAGIAAGLWLAAINIGGSGFASAAVITGSPVVIGTINKGDTVTVQATLSTNDPNENGKGEPLLIRSTGGLQATVGNYASPASIPYTGLVQNDFITGSILGFDGDESAVANLSNLKSPLQQALKQAAGPSAAALGITSAGLGVITGACTFFTGGLCAPSLILTGLTAGAGVILGLVAADPIDPNFMVIATPHAVSLPDLGIFGPLGTVEAQIITIGQALLASVDRYQGALAAGDAFWAQQQLDAINLYQDELLALINQLPPDLAALASAWLQAGFPKISITPQEVLAFEQQLASGAAIPGADVLAQLGLSSSDLDNVRQLTFVQDINQVSGVLSR